MRVLTALSLLSSAVLAQRGNPPPPPKLELLYQMDVQLGERFSMGPIPGGKERVVIPIIGGTFKGPQLSGKVMNVGADWRVTDNLGRYRPEARYNLQISDGTYVFVQTEGPTLSDGRTQLRAKFETATNGSYAWLNDVVGVGEVTRVPNAVIINMWIVEQRIAKGNDTAGSV